MASLSKNTALLLSCYFRQAERSVHYALTFPNEWSQFLAYYDKAKQTQIGRVIDLLKDAGAWPDKASNRQELVRNDWLSIVRCSAALLCNRFKRFWSFSTRELSFFSATLKHLLVILGHEKAPETNELIELRMNCFDCHYIIAGKLIGVSELRKANSIEHFNQSKHIHHYTFQDLGVNIP